MVCWEIMATPDASFYEKQSLMSRKNAGSIPLMRYRGTPVLFLKNIMNTLNHS